MDETTLRITAVSAEGPTTLAVAWEAGGTDRVNLADWIATGEGITAPLSRPEVFAHPRVALFGTAVAWDEDDELLIDAVHLELLAAEQRSFGAAPARPPSAEEAGTAAAEV